MNFLYSNTELAEDIALQIAGSNLSGDLTEVVEGLKDVHGLQVT